MPENMREQNRGLRLQEANRRQLLKAKIVDDLVDEEHVVRRLWTYCEQLDLSSFYENIQTFDRNVGRPPYDPRVLFALWLYAHLQGVTTARELERKCMIDGGFQWIAGGLEPKYHVLSDFRVKYLVQMDELFTQSVESLRKVGKRVDLGEVAHDGIKVRASAGAASFRSPATLETHKTVADAEVEDTKGDFAVNPFATSHTSHAAIQRGALDRQQRVESAIAQNHNDTPMMQPQIEILPASPQKQKKRKKSNNLSAK